MSNQRKIPWQSLAQNLRLIIPHKSGLGDLDIKMTEWTAQSIIVNY